MERPVACLCAPPEKNERAAEDRSDYTMIAPSDYYTAHNKNRQQKVSWQIFSILAKLRNFLAQAAALRQLTDAFLTCRHHLRNFF